MESWIEMIISCDIRMKMNHDKWYPQGSMKTILSLISGLVIILHYNVRKKIYFLCLC